MSRSGQLSRCGRGVLGAALLLVALAACSSPTAVGGAPQGPSSVTAPVVGVNLQVGEVIVAYDAVVGDTLLALGEVRGGSPLVLEIELARAADVPSSRLESAAETLAASCLPGAVQPESLRVAFLTDVYPATFGWPPLTLVTRTELAWPDAHFAILADQPGRIRGSCRVSRGGSEHVVSVDLALDQGWTWVRATPYVAEEPSFSVGYSLDAVVPVRPGADAFWTNLGAWDPGASGETRVDGIIAH